MTEIPSQSDPLRSKALSAPLLARIFHQAALVYFNAVATHLSVREASRRLNVASSAVSRQISHLEDALGLELFEREGRSLKLSPAGEILFHHTRRLTERLDLAVRELEMLRGLNLGTVRIASVETVGLGFLPRLIAEFGARYPKLQIEVSVTSSAEVIERIVNDRADIGFGFVTTPHPQIEIALRRDVRIGAVMRADHPLAARQTLSLGDCLRHPMVIGSPDISIRSVIEPFLQRSVTALPPLVEVDSLRMMVELAQQGHYLAIMTPIGAHAEISSGALVFRPLSDPGLPQNRFGVMVRAGRGLSFAPAAFLGHARSYLAGIELPGSV